MSPKKKIAKQLKFSSSIQKEVQKEANNIPEFQKKVEQSLDRKLTDLLEIILGGAIHLRSSDVHIETLKDRAKLRVRIDGVLQDVLTFPQQVYQKLLSRIKLLSGIKLNITARPQDGRFSVLLQDLSIEIRTSTLPSEYGESIVMRILNPKTLIDLEKLGIREGLLKKIKAQIERPNGMIIVTGPTGCGKTTTLYAFLRRIRQPELKIITIEDPIEYHLKGISQTQVSPSKGYDFASGLESIMRQDPDIILVGEIRDLETSQIALQAALTGHLVFSTLHTNDAAGTVTRLVSLGAKLNNIAPAINMAIAQRLPRRVCKKCVQKKTVSKKELKKIKKALKGLPSSTKNFKLNSKTKIPKAKGCKECNSTGYQGRIGIFEAFLVDPEMEKFILTSPSISSLREKASKKGMVSMYQDGMIKVLKGITTIEEIERVATPPEM